MTEQKPSRQVRRAIIRQQLKEAYSGYKKMRRYHSVYPTPLLDTIGYTEIDSLDRIKSFTTTSTNAREQVVTTDIMRDRIEDLANVDIKSLNIGLPAVGGRKV